EHGERRGGALHVARQEALADELARLGEVEDLLAALGRDEAELEFARLDDEQARTSPTTAENGAFSRHLDEARAATQLGHGLFWDLVPAGVAQQRLADLFDFRALNRHGASVAVLRS